MTTREYNIWLDDMPVAVIDVVNTATPVTYFIHTDHPMRPPKMTNAAKAVAWDAAWKPIGQIFLIAAAPKLGLGFPGQWTQSENGLAWNWNKHYDPAIGKYTKQDPLRFVDGPSLYEYVGGSPLTKIDPLGRAGEIPSPISIPGGPWALSTSGQRPGHFMDLREWERRERNVNGFRPKGKADLLALNCILKLLLPAEL